MDTSLTSGQLAQQLLLFSQKGMTPIRWNRILSSGFFADLCDPTACFDDRRGFRAALRLPATAKVNGLELSVDYSRSLDGMVVDGKYDFVHPAIENPTLSEVLFSMEGSGTQSWQARVIFSDGLTPTVVKGAIHSSGWLPAKIEHLLAFGERYPDEQYKYNVLAVGSTTTFHGDECMPALTSRGHERGLTLYRTNEPYSRENRFLKVRLQTA